MACIVYREGKGTTQHGIECESAVVELAHLDGMLGAGWSLQPPGYVAPGPIEISPVVEDDADVIASMKAEIDSLDEQVRILTEIDELSKDEIRSLKAEIVRLTQASSDEPLAGDEEETNLNPVRIAARDAGIEGWDTKRIATLENLLSEA